MKKTCAFLVLALSFFALAGCEKSNNQTTVPRKTTRKPSGSTTQAKTSTEDPTPIENVTLYVKNNGSSSKDGLTRENATSLTSALEKVRSGDKIILLSGTYKIDKMVSIKKSGSEVKRNELIGEDDVVFDFINTKDDDISRNGGISIEGSYWRIENIKVCNSDNYGFEIKGNGCKINNCISTENCEGGFFVDNAGLTTITNCIASYNTYLGNSASGFYISGNGSNNKIESCVSNNNQDSGFVTIASKAVTFEKCLAVDNGLINFASQRSGFVFNNKGHSFTNCIAYNNELYGFEVPMTYSDKGSYILNNCSSINNHSRNYYLRKSSNDVVNISNILSFNNYDGDDEDTNLDALKDIVLGNVKNSVFLYNNSYNSYSYVSENANYSSSNPSDIKPIDFTKYTNEYIINMVVPEEMKEYLDPDAKALIDEEAANLGVEPDYSGLDYNIIYFKDGKLNIYDYLDRCILFQDDFFFEVTKKPGYFGAYVNE